MLKLYYIYKKKKEKNQINVIITTIKKKNYKPGASKSNKFQEHYT